MMQDPVKLCVRNVKSTIPKNHSPAVLNELQRKSMSSNITVQLKASGIYPNGKNMVVKHLPNPRQIIGGESLNETFHDTFIS